MLSACNSSSDSGSETGPFAAPATVTGRTYNLLIESGNGVFANTGQTTVTFSRTNNTYTVMGDGVNVGDSTGTYSYESFANRGRVTFNDSAAGEGLYELIYLTNSSGDFVATLSSDTAARQTGSFTE